MLIGSIISILVSLILLTLGALIIYRGKYKASNIFFSLFIFSALFWVLSNFFVDIAPNDYWLLYWSKLTLFGPVLMPVTLLYFTYYFPRKRGIPFYIHFINIAAAFLIYYIPSDINILSAFRGSSDIPTVTTGPLYLYFGYYFGLLMAISIINLIRSYKISSGIHKVQIRYVLLGITLSLFFAFITNFLFLLLGVSEYANLGPYFSLIFVAATSYSIVRYRLMDIKLIVAKSILYVIMIVLVATFFVVTTISLADQLQLSTTGNYWLIGVASLIVVIGLDPLKRLLSKITDKTFFRSKIDYLEVQRKIIAILAQEIDLESLVSKVKDSLETELKIKRVDILININNKFYTFKDADFIEISVEPDFLTFSRQLRNCIVAEELKSDIYDMPENLQKINLERQISIIDKFHWEMVVPVIDSNKVTALIGMHHKLSGDIYSNDEINLLSIIAGQLSVAIEKSKYFEEVQHSREDLQTKVNQATQRLRQSNIDLEARNKFLTTTQNISNLISRSLEIKNIIQVIADSIASELGYIGGILSFADAEKKYLYASAITRSEAGMKALAMLPKPANEYKSSVKNKDNLGVKIYLSGQAMTGSSLSDFLSPPVEKEVMDKIQAVLGVQTVVGVPIYAENEIIGVIDYLLAVPESQISKLDMEMMNNLADQIGIVYRNVKLYQELEGANKELQQANFHLMQLDKAKSEFLSIASHQLRTPVSAIKGYLSMMIEGDFGIMKPEQKKIITDVFESASRLARTINIFLNVSRIEAGRFKLTKAPTDMNVITEGVIKELKQQATIKNLKLEWTPPSKPCVINVDGDKIREVVLNLIDNSIKYTHEGYVKVTQELTPTEFHFKVQDSGMGILPDEVDNLFKKFVRGTGVAQVNTQGSGLGLYIAQRVVKEHGGKIWAESPGVGKGSVFQFTIAVDQPVSETIRSQEMKSDTTSSRKN